MRIPSTTSTASASAAATGGLQTLPVPGVGDVDGHHDHLRRGPVQCPGQFEGLVQAQLVGAEQGGVDEFVEPAPSDPPGCPAGGGVDDNSDPGSGPGVEDLGHLPRTGQHPNPGEIPVGNGVGHRRPDPVIAAVRVPTPTTTRLTRG